MDLSCTLLLLTRHASWADNHIKILFCCIFDSHVRHNLMIHKTSEGLVLSDDESMTDVTHNRDQYHTASFHTLIPRLILQTSSPSGMTEATVTFAPKRVKVSVMHVVSISSDPSAIGTSTFFDILNGNDDEYNR
jgi:hypothetical protein